MAIDRNINPENIQRDIANDLVKAIVAKLHTTFGDNYTYYADDVPQGFVMPSFAVMVMSQSRTTGMWLRKFQNITFDVHYFCSSLNASRSEWNTIEQKMCEELEWIDVFGSKLRATFQPSTWDDNEKVGHFFIAFTIPLLEVYEDIDRMDVLTNSDGEYISGDRTAIEC